MRKRNLFSLTRWWSIVLKEFLQLRRDRITFAMIIGLPIVQLALFGFAINTVTGLMLFAADAMERGTSWLFLFKMIFVAVGVVTAVLIRHRLDETGDNPGTISRDVRRLAMVSLFVWTAAVVSGRLLAYV